MPSKLSCLAFATLLFLLSCNSSNESSDNAKVSTETSQSNDLEQQPSQQQPDPAVESPADTAQAPPLITTTTPTTAPSASWDKKIIRTATLTLEVKSVKDYNNTLLAKLQRAGAYTATEENIFSADRSAMQITIKVPVLQFADLMNELTSKETKLIERSVKAEDVTAQYADVKSRLQAKTAVLNKYLELLKQSKNMAEILQVQTEINTIQEEIEVATGRLKYLANQSAYSTINLNFYEPLPGFKPANESPSFISRVGDALADGAGILRTIILGLITIWPLLLLAFIATLFWRRRKPRINNRPTV